MERGRRRPQRRHRRPKTDFWRETHYGFIRDDGHFRDVAAEGDFTADVAFRGDYRELYDQAGLMLRLDERNWIKAGHRVRRRAADAERGRHPRLLRLVDDAAARSTPTGCGCG